MIRSDGDARLVRRASVRVGLALMAAAAVLVIVVLLGAVAFILTQVRLSELLDPDGRPETIRVAGTDLLRGGLAIGVVAIVIAGALAMLTTRRAVAPLVDALARQRRFVADASHELRTPLATLDARVQLLQRSLPPGDRNEAVVAQLRADAHGLVDVVDDLLASADVPAHGRADPIEAGPVAAAAAASLRVLAQERGVRVHADPVTPGIRVALPEATLHRALVALIDNAVKHSPDGARVDVTVTADRRHVRFTVIDRGDGIRGIDPAHVFDRFAHSTVSAHDGGRPGFGIGLSLVHETAARFGGHAEVTRTSARGTTMTLVLPRA